VLLPVPVIRDQRPQEGGPTVARVPRSGTQSQKDGDQGLKHEAQLQWAGQSTEQASPYSAEQLFQSMPP
jgi:hypothetical protein